MPVMQMISIVVPPNETGALRKGIMKREWMKETEEQTIEGSPYILIQSSYTVA